MLTFFTTGKAFVGHDETIQWNALKSWKTLHRDAEVILFGDEPGAAEVCAELGLRHEPKVERHASGKPLLHSMFQRAQEIAQNKYLCFCNCDIVLAGDFLAAFEKARAWREKFLMVSRRWDTDVTWKIDFERNDWWSSLKELAVTAGFQQDESWVDYFVFHKGAFAGMPPLIVGHCYWDHWMIWRSLKDGMAVLDGSKVVFPVHQNHGYAPEFGRSKGMATDALSLANLEMIGGKGHLRCVDAATHRIGRDGKIRRAFVRDTYAVRSFVTYHVWLPMWHRILGATRPLRSALGLRSKSARGRTS